MKRILIILAVLLGMSTACQPALAFVVSKIQVVGLQRIPPATVNRYLPIKPGQSLTRETVPAVIHALYQTGFFEQITVAKSGSMLVINVIERPTIGELKITGNSAIATDKLSSVMKQVGIEEGRTYNPATLDKIKQSLLSQYYELGRYNVRVDLDVKLQTRNRVAVAIKLSEGLPAKIKRITFRGNHAFRDAVLLRQLSLSTSGIFSFISQNDRYSQEKLATSLENLRNFYLDHGYLKFAVHSSPVTITPDRKSVYIDIVVDEGRVYKIKAYQFKGNLLLPLTTLKGLVKLKSQAVFSRHDILEAEKAISSALGDKGYIFATVSIEPQIDHKTNEVNIIFTIAPGKRAYVRHIIFTDNMRTNDVVLRREMVQMEDSVVSTSLLDESKHRLKMLPYLRNVDMTIVPVPQHADQVDVNFKVTEDKTAQATLSVGYSQQQNVILGAGINQKNFLGTGKTIGLNFSHSRFEQFYGASYYDPYFTPDGISRTTSVSLAKFDPGAANITASYTTNEYDVSDMFSIPIGNEKQVINRFQLGYGYQNTLANIVSNPSTAVQNFVSRYGRHFQQIELTAGLSRDSRDQAIFPTQGVLQSIGLDLFLPASRSSLHYYTLNYDIKWYQPLIQDFIFTAKGTLGYGRGFSDDGEFPFFKNYYAGGMGSVRGYLGNSLGPRDSNGKPFGGNFMTIGSLGLIVPNSISENLRTSLFIDGGNVYNTLSTSNTSKTGSLRYSTGIMANWLTPFGLVDVSLARGLNRNPGDAIEVFQFSLGANFG